MCTLSRLSRTTCPICFSPPGQINTVPMKYQVGYLDIVGKLAHFTPLLCYLNVIRGEGETGAAEMLHDQIPE